MAITSKIFGDTTSLASMLDVVFNQELPERFEARDTADALRGESSDGNLYAAASTGSGVATVALSGSVVINVDANSTGASGVTKIVYCHFEEPSTVYDIYTITISPAEEFLYAGTITITTATITLSGTMT